MEPSEKATLFFWGVGVGVLYMLLVLITSLVTA